MADETLNVNVTSNVGASAEELANYDALLKKLAADYKSAEAGAVSFAGAQQRQAEEAYQAVLPFDDIVQKTRKGIKDTVTEVELHLNGLKQSGEALRKLGAESFGGLISMVGEIQQLWRELGSLSAAVPTLIKNIPIAEQALSKLTSVFGADIANMIAFAGPLAAVGLAVEALSAAYNAQKKAADEARKAAIAGLDAQSQYIANINTGSKEIVQKARDDLAKQKKDAEDQIALLQSVPDALKKVITLQGGEGDYTAEINKTFDPIKEQLVQMGAISKETAQTIDARSLFDIVNEKISALQNSTTQAAVGVATYDKALQSNTLHADEAAEAKKQEADATKLATKAAADYSKTVAKSVDELIQVTTQLEEEKNKYADIVAGRIQTDARAGAQAALEAQIAADKVAEAAQDGANKLVEIRANEGQLEVEEATKRAEGIQKINDSFLQNQLKAFNVFHTAEAQDEAHYNTERKRKLEELQASLLGLAGNRDVAGFIAARSKGLTDISHGDEDQTTEQRERQQAYEQQARDAEAARQEQLTQLESSLAKETATKREALQEQEDAQIASNNAKIKQSEVDAKQLSDLQAAWAKTDLANKRLVEDAAHQKTVADLTFKQTELGRIVGNALDPAVSFFNSVSTAIQKMFIDVRNAASLLPPQHVPGGGYASGVNFVPRDMVTKVHYGEKITRAVDNHPQPRQQDNRPIIVNIGGVGSLVSESDLHMQTREIIKAVRIGAGQLA